MPPGVSTKLDTLCKRCGAPRGQHGHLVRGLWGPLINPARGCRGYVKPSSKKKPVITGDDRHRLFKLHFLHTKRARQKGWIK